MRTVTVLVLGVVVSSVALATCRDHQVPGDGLEQRSSTASLYPVPSRLRLLKTSEARAVEQSGWGVVPTPQPGQALYVREHLDNGAPRWTFRGHAHQEVSVTVTSNDFDPDVSMISPSGDPLAIGGGDADSSTSRVDATLPADGLYELHVRAVDGADGGIYRIMVREPRDRVIALGTTARGAFGYPQPFRLDRVAGRWAMPATTRWTFEGRVNQTIRVEVQWNDFVPIVSLLSPTGDLLERTSQLDPVVLPTSGRYHLEIHPSVPLPTVASWMACTSCYDDPFKVAVGSPYAITVR